MAGPVFPDPSKPKKLKNVLLGTETYDQLHVTAPPALGCTHNVCMGSVMYQHLVDKKPRASELVLQQAKDFLVEYYKSLKRLDSPAHEQRWKQVQAEVAKTGTYELTATELVFGAKLAWRNAARCVGRIQWSKLQLFDCRNLTSPRKMFEAICNHLKYATNGGNIRSAITIFKQRIDGNPDYRIWNSQLLSYAGYQNPDGTFVGDPANAEFTSLCLKLGWKSKRTAFDLLPLLLSANGEDPELFEYPKSIILEVPLIHPTYKWFEELNMKWYAVPAVSGMMFDCGGVQFPATAFSGWYMSTEIGCRNLCDLNRRNMLEMLAKKMGLDTRNPTSLWKDKALVEINIAVLYSYQSKNVTIVDHHTASESFVKHCENEQKLRNGCPADWLWIVPPMSPSTVQVYHQEMALYYLKPSFDYQIAAANSHVWKNKSIELTRPRRKYTLKEVVKAVIFASRLFSGAMSRRIKATVLYATETGKSESYAQQLTNLLGHAFNAQMHCMEDYVISQLEHESLVFVVASTFGNGDPPENGESFAQDLYTMKVTDEQNAAEAEAKINQPNPLSQSNQPSPEVLSPFNQARAFFANQGKGAPNKRSSNVFMRQRSRTESTPAKRTNVDRRVSLAINQRAVEPSVGPLANVKFAVFALGSTAYPNYCAFGKYIDSMMADLGGERLMDLATGDEICGQEQAYREWAPQVFKQACESFCLEADQSLSIASKAMKREQLTEEMLRLEPIATATPLDEALAKYHNKKAKICTANGAPVGLHEVTNDAERLTMIVKLKTNNVYYEPGDHVAIYPENRKELVDGILKRLTGFKDPDEVVQLQVLHNQQNWENHGKLPAASIRMLLTRFLDIATPPSRTMLGFLANYCADEKEKDRMLMLANEAAIYEEWRHWKQSHMLEIFEEFKTCYPPVKLFLTQLSPLQPRFYSVSSSPRKYENEIHLTVAIVSYKCEEGAGPVHYGVCSNYLKDLKDNDKVYLFVRNAQSFHIPSNPSEPVVLIGPGTGIAPFRSFWQQWESFKIDNKKAKTPKVWLLFGCRTKAMDLYKAEKKEMVDKGVITKEFLALSREKDVPKVYVQDICKQEALQFYNTIAKERGHIYVCGDVTMAEDVYNTIKKIICDTEQVTDTEAEDFMLQMKDDNRYHEDIFGITLRTAESNSKSRESAMKRMSVLPTNR